MTMVMAGVTALNKDIGTVTDDMTFDQYLEMIDTYKEFVKRGHKIRHRSNREQPYPDEERVVFGKNIKNAVVSIGVSDFKCENQKKFIFRTSSPEAMPACLSDRRHHKRPRLNSRAG